MLGYGWLNQLDMEPTLLLDFPIMRVYVFFFIVQYNSNWFKYFNILKSRILG